MRPVFVTLLVLGLFSTGLLPAVSRPLPSVEPSTASQSRAGIFAVATAGTTWFGGIHWDAVDMRWEALQDSVWTFDSGVASVINADSSLKKVGLHALMEGWIGLDLTAPVEIPYFRRLTTSDFTGEDKVCVGTPAGLSGSASAYAGVLTPEATTLGYLGGRGYGNNWNVIFGKTFSYSGGSITLSYDYVNETEPGFDYTYVELDTSGGGSAPRVALASYTGLVSGHASLALSQAAGTLPSSPGDITIRFRVASDGAYSDEDGLYSTDCGAFSVDDICLTGSINDLSDFEAGDDGWSLMADSSGVGGDWTDIVDVSDLPGIPVGCTLKDSVLVLYDRNQNMIGPDQWNVAVSPWIDLQSAGAGGLAGRVLECDVYQDFVRPDHVGIQVLVQYRPVLPPFDPGFTQPYGCTFGVDPCLVYDGCTAPGSPLRINIERVPPSAEAVRVALGAYNECETWSDCPGVNTDTTPYFDNVRFGVFDTTTVVGVPVDPGAANAAVLRAFHPNPYRGSGAGVIPFYVPNAGPARIEIFDVAGRLVRVVFDGQVMQGENRVIWDGLDDTGQRAPSGIYFNRLTVGRSAYLNKIVLLRD